MGYGLIAILVYRALWTQEPLPTDMHDLSWVAAEVWFHSHPESHLRVELETPIGPLPFVLTVAHDGRPNPDGPAEPDEDGWTAGRAEPYFPATLRVGPEAVPYRFHVRGGGYAGPSRAWLRDESGSLVLTGYGSGSCTTPSVLPRHFLLSGTWKALELSVVQVASVDERFVPMDTVGTPGDFSGRWRVSGVGSGWDGMELQTPDGVLVVADVTGLDGAAFRCEGRVDGDLMRISYFDGGRAVLVRGWLRGDGTLAGEWWDSERGVVSWTGVRE